MLHPRYALTGRKLQGGGSQRPPDQRQPAAKATRGLSLLLDVVAKPQAPFADAPGDRSHQPPPLTSFVTEGAFSGRGSDLPLGNVKFSLA
jgi:hypothetical protein